MDPAAQATSALSDTTERFTGLVDKLSHVATASSCVGEAHTEGGHTVVPVAAVSVQAGFGMGFGSGSGGKGEEQGEGGGGGGGGGGRANARTIAVIDISNSGATVKPIVDATQLILGVLALIGLTMLSRRGHVAGATRRGLLGAMRQRD
jgi:uncharacterized spore protein YtfJ